MNTTELLPDVDRVLKYLARNNQFIALGSASKNARLILKKGKNLRLLMLLLTEMM